MACIQRIALWPKKIRFANELLSLIWYIHNMSFIVALKKGSPLRFNLFIMGYTQHGFVVPLPKIRCLQIGFTPYHIMFTTWLLV
jgi:hypothetical protein